jgi:hypothetical protein
MIIVIKDIMNIIYATSCFFKGTIEIGMNAQKLDDKEIHYEIFQIEIEG